MGLPAWLAIPRVPGLIAVARFGNKLNYRRHLALDILFNLFGSNFLVPSVPFKINGLRESVLHCGHRN